MFTPISQPRGISQPRKNAECEREDCAAALRILITSGIFPPDIGGPATYVPLVASMLRGKGHRVHVLTTGVPGISCLGEAESYYTVERVVRRPISTRTVRFFMRVYSQAQVSDVVLANGMFQETVLAAKLAATPVVAKLVGDEAWERSIRKRWTTASLDEFQSGQDNVPVRLLKTMRSTYVRAADHVIVPSCYLQKIVRRWGVSEDRCTVVYNAVVGSMPRPVPSRLRGQYRILTVGRLVAWKGMDLLLGAVRQLPDVRLTIVGDGPERSPLETLATRYGVAHRVAFEGQVAPERVRELMREHDLFVLASRYEGLPHIVLEAMQEQIPVIATRAGGTAEVVDPGITGLLVDANEDQIVRAVQQLRADPACARAMVASARRLLAERFSVERMVAETEAVLRRVLPKAPLRTLSTHN